MYYNIVTSRWEPFIEAVKLKCLLQQETSKSFKVQVECEDTLNFNVSVEAIKAVASCALCYDEAIKEKREQAQNESETLGRDIDDFAQEM